MSELPEIVVAPPGPRSRALASRLAAVESPAFEARRDARAAASGSEQAPIVYARAAGSNVWDADGNRYVDLTAGFGAMILGHAPNLASEAARAAFADLPLALGDVYASETKVKACEAIASLFPERGARVMLGLSGADAVTCALKTAMLATKRAKIIAFHGSYHGLSYAPLAACGLAASFREPFAAQLGDHVVFVPYPSSVADLDASLGAVRAALKAGDVGAVLVEPMLGRGGCVTPPSSFLAALRSLTYEAEALLVADEIWTGMGRTGAMLGCDLVGVVPDVVCLGKGLGGGVPISACVGRASVMEAWGAHGGSTIHTGTHFGSPPACAAALAVIEALRGGVIERAEENGERLRAELEGALASREGIAVTGRGMMIGIALGSAATALSIARALLAKGFIVLTGGSRGDVLTLSPPLVLEPELASAFVAALCAEIDRT
ncbi:MAG: aspartate aminotransferase family protein [Deltaproteobacteria bacterium]|nr:aspartate aminotransferase family protein [Deltaproteobacteria bacterium]